MSPRMIKQDRSTSEVDFRTPPDLFEALNAEFGVFTLDVAASAENHLAPAYFTVEQNALEKVWVGKAWCNPPYNKIKPWVEKGIQELHDGNLDTITYLLPASSCTRWFKMLWEHEMCTNIIFLSGRLSFQGPHVHPDMKKAAAPNPTVIFHLDRRKRIGTRHIELRKRDYFE